MPSCRKQLVRLVVLNLASFLAPASWAQFGVLAGGGPLNGVQATSVSVSQPNAVIVDGAGNLYVAASQQNRVYEVAPNGAITTVAGNGAAGFSGDGGQATGAQLNSPGGLAVDSAGNLYIADSGNNRIRRVAVGIITTIAGSATSGFSGDNGLATNAQLNFPTALALDNAGNLYIADVGNSAVRKVANGIIVTVAGTGSFGFSGDNGPAANAQLSDARGVAVDSGGNVYIGDTTNNRIRKITHGIITTVAGIGTFGSAGDGGAAVSAQLSSPQGVAVDASGNLYIADTGDSRIRKVANGVITTVAGNGTAGYSGDGGPAVNAQLAGPIGVAVDGGGNLYISDTSNDRVRKVAGGSINTIAGNGSFDFSGDAGPATNAQLNPTGVAVDNNGNVYIADFQDYRIRKVTNGVITTAVGNGIAGFTGDNGPAASAEIGNVQGIAVDGSGNLYLADNSNARIRKVAGGFITTIGGNGVSGYSGDGGSATNAEITTPQGIAANASGNVFFTDQSNNRVRKISGGVITMVAGGGPPDGVAATSVSLGNLTDAATDSAGNIYVPSPGQNRVYMITPGGAISTVAGNGLAAFSGDGGLGASAQLNNPQAVAVDNNTPANLYIADSSNGRIRKVAGGIITTVAGGGVNCAQATDNAGDGCPPLSSNLIFPSAVAVDHSGNLYIGDTGHFRVRKVSGGVITTVAGNGLSGFSGDGGPATSAQVSNVFGVTVDSAGANLYIADTGNNRIRRVSGGVIATVAGNGTFGFSGDGGAATNAQLEDPQGVEVDSAGVNLYIADSNNARIRKVAGGLITTVAGNGILGYAGDGALATSAELGFVTGLTLDSGGALYLADNSNFRVRKVANNGIISTVAGNGFYSYSGDGGSAANAQLDSPSGLATDSAGNLYISDIANGRVRVVSPGGTISNFAGGGTQGLGDGGPATSAALSSPQGLATDSANNLYIQDIGNGLLREVSGGVINTIATVGGNGTFTFVGDGGLAVDSSFNVYDSEPTKGVVYRLKTPATAWRNDVPVTVGVKFRSDVSGAVTGIRFYKGASNTGSHIGLLYSYNSAGGNGSLLATAVFTGETDSGWQTVSFISPVVIQANTTYIAAYWSSTGYADDAGYFTNAAVNESPIHLLQSGVDGPNGVYTYGNSPQFPALSSGNPNYWVDVAFTTATLSTAQALRFVPVTPCRVADTRNAAGPFGGPSIAGGTSRNFTIPSSACNIPPTAQAYSLNVAVVPAGPLGFLTLWPSGQSQPAVSALNSLDGSTKSDASIVPAGVGGAISVFASNTTDVVLDINGYFVPATDPTALAFFPVTPCRIADTRQPSPTFGAALTGGQMRSFPILSSTCSIPATAQAYSLSLTAVPSGPLGFLTAWPAGQGQPGASSLNAITGTITANAAIIPAGAGGAIDIFASNGTNLVIDINGYFAPMATGGLSLYNVSPCRALDTRQPAGSPPFNGQLDTVISGNCGVPFTAQAIVLNATVVPPSALGFLTLWPQSQSQPMVSTLNALDGEITSNLAIVPTMTGSISAFASNPTHLILDIFGYFAP